MSLTINTPHESHVTILVFTAHYKKLYPYFSYTYTIEVKNENYFKPNASQVFHIPFQPTLPLSFKSSEIEIIFPIIFQPYFNSRFNSYFEILQVYQNSIPEPNSCSVIIQIVTHHSAIFSPGYFVMP